MSFSTETHFNTSYLHYKQPQTFLHQISNHEFFKNPKKLVSGLVSKTI